MSQSMPLVFSVTSGKGGVGKTNLSVNLAYALTRLGKRTVLMDADLGLANVDVLLGMAPEKNLFHLFHENVDMGSILQETEYGFTILPAASGVSEMLSLSTGQKLDLLEGLDMLEDSTDILLVDTGAGINDNVIYFNLAVQHRILILTPEPTSLTDAYALIKILKNLHDVNSFAVIVNMARDIKEARQVFSRLHAACDHFLSGVSLDILGYVPRDTIVRKAVVQQVPFLHLAPDNPASRNVMDIARTITQWSAPDTLDGNIKFFWKKLLFRE